MLRLGLFFIGLLLIWVLLFSKQKKPYKIGISIMAIVSIVIGIWMELKSDILSTTLISVDQITICSVTTEHSYRSNYNIRLCLNNAAPKAIAKRITINYVALHCDSDCQVIDETRKERQIDLHPLQQITLLDNVRFDKIGITHTSLKWRAEIVEVKSIPLK